MTPAQTYLIVVVTIPLIFVSLDKLRIDLAALLIAVLLGLAQFLGMDILGASRAPGDAIKAISGFSQPVVLTLLSLFIITTSLEKSGIARLIARYLLTIGGRSERRLIALFAASTAILSLVMNNLAAGALILPSAMEIARRTGIKPSKLLIPVAYGSLLGGGATYFTTANIIISNLLTTTTPPQPALHILAFIPTGGLIAVIGLLFLIIFGPRWLPERNPAPEYMMVRLTGSELEDYYNLGERLWEVRVLAESPIANNTLSESLIGERYGLEVAGVWHGHQAIFAPPPDQIIQPDDILLIVGREERVSELVEAGLVIGRENTNEHISELGVSIIEMMPAPHSQAIGRTLRDLEFRTHYKFTALSLNRSGRSYRTDVGKMPLSLGDSLLMIGSPKQLKRLRNNPDFILLEPDLSDQPLQRLPAFLTMSALAASIAASILGVPVYLSMLAGALFLLLTRTIEMDEAYQAVRWQAIMLIAGMYTVSIAMTNTGLAQIIGEKMIALVDNLGPLGLAGGAYVLTALLTQVIGGQVAALVTGPITISAAISLNTNPQAIAVATAIGCSVSFFTPMAHPVNILMISPANYQFRDFFHFGWRLSLVCFLVLLIGMVIFWGL